MTVDRRRHDVVVTAVIVAGVLFLLWETYSFSPSLLPGYPGDAFFPRIIIAFTLAAAAIVIIQAALRRPRSRAGAEPKPADVITIDVPVLVLVVALVAAYALLLSAIGFEIASFLFLAVFLTPRLGYEGKRAFVMGVLISAATVALMYLCFVLLLGVDMPLLFLPKYIDF